MNRHNRSVILALVAGFVFALGCAAGTEQTGDDGEDGPDAQAQQQIDASQLAIDARPIDASPLPIDASLPIDANTGGGVDIGGACTASAQCISNCCFGGSVCFEDPGIPGFCT